MSVGLLLIQLWLLNAADFAQGLEEAILNPNAQPYGITLQACELEF